MSLIVGIDPGVAGAAALCDVQRRRVLTLVYFKPYRVSGDWLEIAMYENLLEQHFGWASLAVIEAVSAAPSERQGVSSAFSFGTAYGLARGLCAGLGIQDVRLPRPNVWKAALGLPADKLTCVQRAEKEFPGTSFRGPRGGLLDGGAEACLLALFGERFLSPLSKNKKGLDLLSG